MVSGSSLCCRVFTWNPLLPGPAPWWRGPACAGGCLPGIPCCQDLLHGVGVQPVLEVVYLESLAARTCSKVLGSSMCWRVFTWNSLMPGPAPRCRGPACAGGCLPGISCCQDLLHGVGVQPVLEGVEQQLETLDVVFDSQMERTPFPRAAPVYSTRCARHWDEADGT